MHIDFTIHFEESWRIGSGQAAGRHLDLQIRKDSRGLPFVPASTLRGVVGTEIEKLAEILDLDICDGTVRPSLDAEKSDSQPTESPKQVALGDLCGVTRTADVLCPRCALLGSVHQEGHTEWDAAHLRIEGGEPGQQQPELIALAATTPHLLSRPRVRTAIDRESGRAKDEFLFALEEARPELKLSSSVEIANGVSKAQLALLVAGLRSVRSLGAGRRRGLGACRIQIDTADFGKAFSSWKEAIEYLPKIRSHSEAHAPLRSVEPIETVLESNKTSRKIVPVLEVDIQVVGEVAIGARPDMGNVIEGLHHIPGSTLRGALARHWKGNKDTDCFRRCFVDGAVRFGYAFPFDGRQAILPPPLSLHTCKNRPGGPKEHGHGEVDTLLEPNRYCPQKSECKGRLIPWNPRLNESQRAVPMGISPHNRIDRHTETVRDGSLFAYEAMADGSRLRGFIAAPEAEDLDLLVRNLGLGTFEALCEKSRTLKLRVGRRKAAGGHLLVTFGQKQVIGSDRKFLLYGEENLSRVSSPTRVRIDLLSPTIVVDEYLRYGHTLTPKDLGLGQREFVASESRSIRLAGWNTQHRLPKPEVVAIAAGSTFLLDGVTETELDTIQELRLRGIGRRTAEGFGTFKVSLPKSNRNAARGG